jgi:sulfur carrier protein ThiS adenylyltransferase
MKQTFSSVLPHFYSVRQILKLSNVKIGIAGAGGLGSNCACALVRCGFSSFVIADFDRVELTNLNRQAYTLENVGAFKVDCLRGILQSINPEINVVTHPVRINADNIRNIFDSCDVIVEAFDKAESKAMIVSEFLNTEKLIVSVSGIGGYGDSDSIVTKKIRENFYLIGDDSSEVGGEVKPYAPRVIVAAAKQADVVLSYMLKDCG